MKTQSNVIKVAFLSCVFTDWKVEVFAKTELAAARTVERSEPTHGLLSEAQLHLAAVTTEIYNQ